MEGQQDPAKPARAHPLITEALRHFPGIGPARLAQLHSLGVRSWFDLLHTPDSFALRMREPWMEESRRCLEALATEDIQYFVDRFDPSDKWRISNYFLDQMTFLDIETMGLEKDSPITVIVCWHRGELHTFVEHENLDDVLILLDDVSLLASFNGSSFDVPRLEQSFHIPQLPCPHLDFRWICYHQGLRGGLKEITRQLAIDRPHDLYFADGAMAVSWWYRWIRDQDRCARDQLVRYCAADVLLLVAMAHRIAGRDYSAPWSQLPAAPGPPTDPRGTWFNTETGSSGLLCQAPLE